MSEILVEVGDRVERGETVALLDNLGRLESDVLTAEAEVEVREAALAQTQGSVRTSLEKARAEMERAEAAAEEAASELARVEALRGAVWRRRLRSTRRAR